MWFNARITYYTACLILQHYFLLSSAEFSFLTALPIKYAQQESGNTTTTTPTSTTTTQAVRWEGGEEGAGAENTEIAPFLLESTHPATRDHKPVSFLHVNELFSHPSKKKSCTDVEGPSWGTQLQPFAFLQQPD